MKEDRQIEVSNSSYYRHATIAISFITYWFTLINIVRSTSIERFEKVKRTFKGRNIKNYPDEDVELMSTDLHNRFTARHEATMYDQNMSVGMVNCFLDAGSRLLESCKYEYYYYYHI